MKIQLSLRTLFGLTTIVAVVFAIFRNVPKEMLLMSFLSVLVMVGVVFALFGFFFLIVAPFVLMHRDADRKLSQGSSPFAHDRLPTQKILTDDRGTE